MVSVELVFAGGRGQVGLLGFGTHTRPSTGMWFLVLKRPMVANMPMAATMAATGRDQEVLRACNCSIKASVRKE